MEPVNINLIFKASMFTFGIFSTHMPYIIMVLSYAVYFLFASPVADRLKLNADDAEPENTEWVQDDDVSINLITGYDYNAVIDQDRNTPTNIASAETIFPPPDPPDLSPHNVFLTFCRPPPFLS